VESGCHPLHMKQSDGVTISASLFCFGQFGLSCSMELIAPVPRGSDAVQAPETITTRGIPERTATLFQLPCYDNCVSGSKDVLLDVV
jgi:hypothetical protein